MAKLHSLSPMVLVFCASGAVAMEQTLDWPLENSKPKVKKSAPLIKALKRQLPNHYSEQDKNKVCTFVMALQKTNREKYEQVQQLLGVSNSGAHVTRSAKEPDTTPAEPSPDAKALMEKQLAILQVVADAFRQSAQDSDDNNVIQAQQAKLTEEANKYLKESNEIALEQNRWDRKVTIGCGIVNGLLGFSTLALGIATAWLSYK